MKENMKDAICKRRKRNDLRNNLCSTVQEGRVWDDFSNLRANYDKFGQKILFNVIFKKSMLGILIKVEGLTG